ncbi:MAG TPA: EH signature domain-containing protein, partial [Pseudomonadales bacterium]|nr:EH signature domain-containing protein [Pseudomonadales bacterium]
MRVPLIEWPITDWDSRLLERWTDLESKAADMSEAAGSNDAFDSAVAELRNMASTGQFSRLLEILRRRTVARALTWLWLNDEQFSSKMLNPRLLETLLEAQAPRFTRMTLQQLAQLYFRRFDQLDKQHDVRELLERILLQQLEKIPPLKIQSTWIDPLVTLKREAHWLLTLNGPATLAKRVQESGRELGATFQEMGLQGFDDGRYGDVCRAHFYLDTLRNLPVG